MTPEAAALLSGRDTLAQALREAGLSVTDDARDRLLGLAWMESRLGELGSWAGSHNWGAVRMTNPAWGAFVHQDHDADGRLVTVNFQRYPTALDGARGFLRTLVRGAVPAALASGGSVELARAMYANGFYTGVSGTAEDRITAYARAVDGGMARVRALIGGASASAPAWVADAPRERAGGGVLALAVVIGIGIVLARR